MGPKQGPRVDPRLALALAAAKGSGVAIRALGRGGGTAAPGLIADKIDPNLLAKITARLPLGSVVVAGTNGKTTTSRMIADVLEANGWRVAHNRSGSNLVRGVASALAEQSSLLGTPNADIGVIESDEAALLEIARQVKPRMLVLNNLFRDQLDRYGELATIARSWRTAIAGLGPETTLVVNADDPTLADLAAGAAGRVITFGMEDRDPRHLLSALPHAVDATTCRSCGAGLEYAQLYSAHLGSWRCPGCGKARPALGIAGTALALHGVDAVDVTVHRTGFDADLQVRLRIPGIYNAYNALAATAAATALEIDGEVITGALGAFQSAFGRIERVSIDGRTLVMALVKNPVGFNETLRMLTGNGEALTTPTMIAINDRFADGRDVSWLWDVDFELLARGDAPLFTTGVRGADMANRLKYAGVDLSRIVVLPQEPDAAIDAFVAALPIGETGYVLPTYTAMLDLRQALAGRGAVESFWRQ